jgi:hypothetical protein
LLLKEAGAGQHLHLGDFSAQTVFNDLLAEKPLALAVIDEFVSFLSRIVSPKAGGWERALIGQFNQLWGTCFGPFGTTKTKQQPSVTIQSPAFSLFGAATPDEFWKVLQGDEVTNGFFSRFLVFESAAQVPERNPLISPDKVPAGLKARLAEIYEFGSGPLDMAQLNDPNIKFEPQDVPWASAEAEKVYFRLSRWADYEVANDPSKRAYLPRVAETAVRLATNRAIGIAGHRAKVDVADMTWGGNLASLLITRSMVRSQECLSLNQRGQFAEKLDNVIARKGSMTSREVQQYVRSNYSSREIADILNQMVAAGRIVKLPNGSYGAPPKP